MFFIHASPSISDLAVLTASDSSLFQYEETEGTFIEILKCEDRGLLGSDLMDILQIDANCYLATMWTGKNGENDLLIKTPINEFSEKKTIVIASLSSSDDLKRIVVSFNQTSEEYRIIIEDYDASYGSEEGYLRLDSNLVSRNAPDILDLTGLDVSKYAEKGMLEDLSKYMEDEDIINRGNYLGNLLDRYTIKGRKE